MQSLPTFGAVEDHRVDTHQSSITDLQAVDHGIVADGDVLTNDERLARIAVEHGAILNIAAGAHLDQGRSRRESRH